MTPDVIAVVIVAALPTIERLADKIAADRKDARRAKGGQQ